MGDAAHLTNPYAGLGLASGIADAAAVSKVLARIVRGEARGSEVLLEAWSEARRTKFLSVVDRPSRMAHAAVQTDVSTPEKTTRFLESDPRLVALRKGISPMPPSLETICEELDGW